MAEVPLIALSSQFRVELIHEEKAPNPDKVEQHVSKLWSEAQLKRPGQLTDGIFLSCIESSASVMQVKSAPYRYFIASREDSQLLEQLHIAPVAVTGMLLWERQVLLGRRSSMVTQYPGAWEFVPSGGLELRAAQGHVVNYRKQLLWELEEETGICPSKVHSINPRFLSWEGQPEVLDIVAEMHLIGPLPSLQFSNEHTELRWVSAREVSRFLSGDTVLVPLTKTLLSRLFL